MSNSLQAYQWLIILGILLAIIPSWIEYGFQFNFSDNFFCSNILLALIQTIGIFISLIYFLLYIKKEDEEENDSRFKW